MVHEMTAGFSHNHWGFRVGTGGLNDRTTRASTARTSASIRRGWSRSGRTASRTLAAFRLDEYPYLPNMTLWRRHSDEPRNVRGGYNRRSAPTATARAATTARCRAGTRTIASRSRTTCRGRKGGTTSSSGSSPSATARPSPARTITPAFTTSATTPTTRSARATASPTPCSASSRPTRS